MQNSGLGVSTNALLSLNQIYDIPTLLVVSWRGQKERGDTPSQDAPEHLIMGAVMEDYLRTNDLWTGHVGRYPELDIDTRAAIVEARTPYLEAAFEVVRADFGGPEAFAERSLGLDAAARERLKADLLER